ncbi:hypothetical protein D3C77_371940 [compost metagenome]
MTRQQFFLKRPLPVFVCLCPLLRHFLTPSSDPSNSSLYEFTLLHLTSRFTVYPDSTNLARINSTLSRKTYFLHSNFLALEIAKNRTPVQVRFHPLNMLVAAIGARHTVQFKTAPAHTRLIFLHRLNEVGRSAENHPASREPAACSTA